MRALNFESLKAKFGRNSRVKGLGGVIISVAIATGAIFALTHTLKNVDYGQVFEIIRATDFGVVVLALMLVTASYGSITLYDWLALHTMGRKDVPYRIAALASFTSYPIAHGIGAVALVLPTVRTFQIGELSLRPIIPATISVRQRIRIGSVGSL